MTTQAGVTELVDVLPDWDDEPECDHSEHLTGPEYRHAGPARWATTIECRGCHHIFHGLRCDQWRTWLLTTRGRVFCTCDYATSNYDFYRDTHWRKL